MQFLEILGLIITIIIGSIGGMLVYGVISGHIHGKKEPIISEPLDLVKIRKRHSEEMSYIEGSQKVTIANLRSDVAGLITKNGNLNKKLDKINQIKLDDSTIEENSLEHLQANYEIDPIKAAEYMKKMGLNPNVLTNPALAQEGWKRLHENKLAAMAFGVLVPKGGGSVTSITDILKNTGKGEVGSSGAIDPIDAIVDKLEN